MYKQAILAGAVGVALSVSAQADYQFEAVGAYATGELTTGSGADADQDIFTLGGAYYLEAVDSSKGPLSEAAFIDRASGIQLAYSFGEIDFENGGDNDISNISVAGRYVMPDSGWLFELGYDYDDGDNTADSDAYTLRAGKYIAETTTLVAGWSHGEDDNNNESDSFTLELEHLHDLGEAAIKFDAGIGLIDTDFSEDINIYSVGATYYVNDNLGFGANYALSDSDDADIDQYTVFGEYWVNETLAFSLGYTGVEQDASSVESDALIFAVTGRF